MKARWRAHWISRYMRDTGLPEETAVIAFENWWRQSAMSWIANLTGSAIVAFTISTAVVWSSLNQTADLEAFNLRVAAALTGNHATIIRNENALCKVEQATGCSPVVHTAPER